MAGVNKAIILGNLGKDPEIKTLDSGKRMATFSVATSEAYTNQAGERVESSEWHNIVFFGKVVDVIEKYLKKGSQVYIEGKLNTRSYEDKDGNKKYTTQVIGDNLTLLGKPAQSNEPSIQTNTQGGVDDLPF